MGGWSKYSDSPYAEQVTPAFCYLVLSYLPKSVQKHENFTDEMLDFNDKHWVRKLKFCDTLEELGYNVPQLFKWVKTKENIQ